MLPFLCGHVRLILGLKRIALFKKQINLLLWYN